MVWNVRRWAIRTVMAWTMFGLFGIIMFGGGGGISERDLAETLGFGEYSWHIFGASVILFGSGVVVLTVFGPDSEE
ncbi:MAG: hypothetical protein ACOC2A_01160 [Halanaeroarchaeum sp.]